MPFNPDGTWTSPKTGKTYPGDVLPADMDPIDNQALSEELRNNNLTSPNILGDGTTQTNPFKAPNVAGQEGGDLDTSLANQKRDQLGQMIGQMQQQAATGDGAWQRTFAESVQRSKDMATALGSSAPGSDYGSSLRNINSAQEASQARSVGDEQVLRAQSQQSARQQLSDVLGQQAQTDLSQSAQQAGARQSAREMQVQLDKNAQQNTTNAINGAGSIVTTTAKLGASSGGRVPGRPAVFGDDSRNDTVPAMLSPQEIVVPISAAKDPDKAAAFARAVAQRGGARHYDDGGSVAAVGGGLFNGPKRQSASIANGGALDRSQLDQTQSQQDVLASLFSGEAMGSGPSIAAPMLQRSNDETLGLAHAASQRGAPQSFALNHAALAGEGAAGDAARQVGSEQSRGMGAFARAIQQRRAQELGFAGAQQQAGWRNTALNAGVSLADQAAVQGLLSGAGQAATSFASSGGGRGSGGDFTGTSDMSKWDKGSLSDAAGDRGGPSDLSASDPDFKAFGGSIGYADGGEVDYLENPENGLRVPATGPDGPRVESHAERKRIEHEEETGDAPPAKHAHPAAQESAWARTIRTIGELSKHVGASVSGMADGGPVQYAGYDPSLLAPPDAAMVFPPGQEPAPMPAPSGRTATPADLGIADTKTQAPPMDFGPTGPFILPDTAPPTNRLPVQHPDRLTQTLVQTGAGPDGMPIVEPRDVVLQKPIPGLRPKDGGSQPAATPAAVKPKGGPAGPSLATTADAEAKAAAQTGYEAAAAESAAKVNAAAAEASAVESQVAERKAVAAKAQERVAASMAKYNEAQAEMARIDTTVDPGRFWATRTTGDKVVGILGLVLGALGTGPDGINKAAVMLNNAVDRDIEAQKAEHEMRLKKGAARIDAAKSYYSMARDAAGDELAATDLAHAAALQGVAARGREMIAKTGDAQAKAQLQAFVASVDQGAAARVAKATEKAQDRAVEIEKALIGAGGRNAAGSAERQKATDDVETATRNIRDNIAKAKAIIARSGTFELTGTDQTELKRALSLVATDSARLKDPGSTVREGELEAAKEEIGLKGGELLLRNSTASSLLDSFEKTVEQRRANALRVRGVTP